MKGQEEEQYNANEAQYNVNSINNALGQHKYPEIMRQECEVVTVITQKTVEKVH